MKNFKRLKMTYCILANKQTYKINDYLNALRLFNNIVKHMIKTNNEAFGDNGLPLSFEAYLYYDDDLANINLLKEKGEKIFKIFASLNNNEDLVDLKSLEAIKIKNEEWLFTLEKIDNQIVIAISDGEHFLMTNIFSNLAYQGGRYFNYYLEKVVTTVNIKELGKKVRGNIILVKDI